MADHARSPVDARANQEVLAIGKKLKHLYEIDLDRLGYELRRSLQKIANIVAPERFTSKFGQGGNLLSQLIGGSPCGLRLFTSINFA